MSFGFSISDLLAVLELASKVRKRFIDAPKQFKALSDEVKSLSSVLRDFEDILSQRDVTPGPRSALKEHILECGHVLTDVTDVLDKYQCVDEDCPPSLHKRSRKFWTRLSWEPDEIRELRSRLVSIVGILNTSINSLQIGLSSSIEQSIYHLTSEQEARAYQYVAEWISPSDPAAQQNDLFMRCQDGTGQWLLDSDAFQSWLSSFKTTLFCPGIPGAGKTFLSSIVVHDLQERYKGDKYTRILYLYFNHKQREAQNIDNLMRGLLRQLLQSCSILPHEIKRLYDRHKPKGTLPSLEELSLSISAALHDCSRAYIIIDALDECVDGRTRFMLMKEIHAIQVNHTLNVFTTSRPIPEVIAEVQWTSRLEIRATDSDVRRYLVNHMTDLPACVQKSQTLQTLITTEVTNVADGMFLLARLHLHSLSDKTTVKAIKAALKELPHGSNALHDAYREAMDRIECQKAGFASLAKQTLAWIVCARRQLSTLELQCALAVEDDTSELDEENMPDIEEMISVCAGLVTVDERSSVIRLVHYTMQEYFEQTLSSWLPGAEQAHTKTCLTYLGFKAIVSRPWYRGPSLQHESSYDDNIDPDGPWKAWSYLTTEVCHDNPFLQYAASHWGAHAEICWDKSVEQMVFQFLDDDRRVASCMQIAVLPNSFGALHSWYENDHPPNVTALHLISYLGLETVLSRLVDSGCNINLPENHGRRALSYAALGGHSSTFRLLMENDASNLNAQDDWSHTPLSYALMSGSEEIITMMLKNDKVHIDTFYDEPYNRDKKTPLGRCCELGFERAVHLLLGREGIDVNYHYGSGTPLMLAAGGGHLSIVRTLLNHDGIKVNGEGTLSPLRAAVKKGHEDVTRFLLEHKEIDVNRGSPIVIATEKNNHNTFQMLITRSEIDVNPMDDYWGRTPLMWAAKWGNEAMTKLLLDKSDIRINISELQEHGFEIPSSGPKAQSALMLAAARGHEGVVKQLLAKPSIDINFKDRAFDTAIRLAAGSGHAGVVKMLLQREDIDIHFLALTRAAEGGHEDVVKLLLNRKEVDPSKATYKKQTALMLAAKNGHEEVVRLLLPRCQNQVLLREDENGKTAMMLAVANGYDGIVKLLDDDIRHKAVLFRER